MIEILSPADVRRARDTGALVAHILQTLRSRSQVGTNLLDYTQAESMVRHMIEGMP